MQFVVTLQNYRDAVKRKLKIPTDQDNGEWSNAYLLDAINEARRAFWEKARYRAKTGTLYINSSNGVADYSLSGKNIEDIDRVRFYNGSDYLPVKFVPIGAFLELTRTAQSGDPVAWTEYGKNLKLYPTPNDTRANAIEVWGTVDLTDLAAVGDIDGNIEERYFDLIVQYTLGLCFAEAEQERQANVHFAIFEKRFNEQAFAINSITMGENTPDDLSINGDESQEWRWRRPLS